MKGRSVFIVLFNRFSRIFPRDAIKRLTIKFKRIIIKIKIIMILKLKSDRLLGHRVPHTTRNRCPHRIVTVI